MILIHVNSAARSKFAGILNTLKEEHPETDESNHSWNYYLFTVL